MEIAWKGFFPNSYTRNLDIQVEIPTKKDFENALRGGEGVVYTEGTNMEDFLYCSYYDSSGVKKGHSVLIGKDEKWSFYLLPQ